MPSLLIENCLPIAIINDVIRTSESVVLNDAPREGKFTLDPYIRAHQPQSILCAPLLPQGKLSGIVYLENKLSTGAFSCDRIEVLQLLSGQAAIAITNAKLYAEVKERESRRNSADVALIAADELSSLLESVYLLRSPANAKRLFSAIEWAKSADAVPQSLADLRQELGIES